MLNAVWAHFNNHAANQFGRSPPVAVRPRRLRTSRKSDICRCRLPHLDEARSVYLLCDTCVRRHTRVSALHHQRFRRYTSNKSPGVIVQSEEYSPTLGGRLVPFRPKDRFPFCRIRGSLRRVVTAGFAPRWFISVLTARDPPLGLGTDIAFGITPPLATRSWSLEDSCFRVSVVIPAFILMILPLPWTSRHRSCLGYKPQSSGNRTGQTKIRLWCRSPHGACGLEGDDPTADRRAG